MRHNLLTDLHFIFADSIKSELMYGCLFVAKFNGRLSCVRHIDLNTLQKGCLIFSNNIVLF